MAIEIKNHAQLSFRSLLQCAPKSLSPLNLLLWRKKAKLLKSNEYSLSVCSHPLDTDRLWGESGQTAEGPACVLARVADQSTWSAAHFLFCLWPIPCGLLRSVCDNNKTHYCHDAEKSTWVDWPSLECCVKFSAPPSLPLLHLSVRYAVTGSVFLTNTSTEISNQPSALRRYRHLSGNAPISFSI